MQRAIVYAGSIPLETDILKTNQYAMVGLAKLAAAMLGTSTVANGLAAVPTSPASLSINVNAGELYSLQNLENTAYSSLPADTAHQILKQGVLLDPVNLSCPAPSTSGQSINYLIEATFQEADQNLVALPYYNASNPTQAWSGPNNSGTPQATIRSGNVVLTAKAGTAATTGTQVTPAPDSGYTGLWVVTVANGQTQILAGNITQFAGAPILPSSLLSSIQTGNLSYAVATGSANAHVVALTPALTQRVDGMVIRYKAPAANTTALTLNDGIGTVAVVGGAHAALQGGETATNGDVWVQWNSSIGGGSYVMLDSTGGALQVAPATQSQHALQLGQATGRILAVTPIASSVTFTFQVATTKWRLRMIGGGGASGGTAVTASGQGACSGAGASGSECEAWFTTNPGTANITIGAGGTGGTAGANNGGQGSSSTLTATGISVTCPGGPGGVGGTAVGTAAATSGSGNATACTITGVAQVLKNNVGQSGSTGLIAVPASSVVVAGNGGGNSFGSGGAIAGNVPATSYGAGAASRTAGVSSAAQAGYNAANGYAVIEEYA